MKMAPFLDPQCSIDISCRNPALALFCCLFPHLYLKPSYLGKGYKNISLVLKFFAVSSRAGLASRLYHACVECGRHRFQAPLLTVKLQ